MDLSKVYGQAKTVVTGPAIPALGATARTVRLVKAHSGMFESLEHMRDSWRAAKGVDLNGTENFSYSAARPSKFRRNRQGLGGSADAHYFNEFEFWQLREYARDMDRNDVVVQAMLDRVLDNIVGDGYLYDPKTGDDGLDDELWDRWDDWSTSKLNVDLAKKFDFNGLERIGLRTTIVEGDCFLVPQRDLTLQFLEGDRAASPPTYNDDVVHGVEVNPFTEEPISYYFKKAAARQRKLMMRRVPTSLKSEEVFNVKARRSDGTPNVLHIFDASRYTQNRGVTWFKSIFDVMGMFEDINFARLVQQQMVACVAMFITRERDYQWGNRDTQNREDGTEEVFEEMHPGLVARLRPGEKVEGFNPNVPNPDYLPFVRMILRMIGMALGLPLELVLFDTTDTTFHGYRGAVDQARVGFRRRQKWLETALHRPLMQILLKAWTPDLGILSAKTRRKLFKHVWRKPAWPYIDPKVDAEADRIRLRNGLTSMRRLHAERNGVEWDDVKKEIIEDNSSFVLDAVLKANEINKKIPEGESKVTWREIAHLDAPEGMTRQEKIQEMPETPAEEGEKPDGEKKEKADAAK